MSFIHNYLTYNAGNECPRNYHLWSALCVLSAAVGRRVYINQGYFTFHPALYVCLVGKQGNRKSTAKDIARELFVEVHPDIPVAAESMTREAIYKFLGSNESVRAYTDEKGALVEWHPFVLFINELKHFLSVNPSGMIEFLTNIYDRNYFDVSTKNKGCDVIYNPYLTVLACETPDWIIDKLKTNIISGGFSRRMIYVYETKRGERIPFPEVTLEATVAWQKVKEHLRKVTNYAGGFQWSDDAKAFYANWYTKLVLPTDPVMAGYYESKHIQLLKISMLLALAEDEPKLVLTKDLLVLGLAILDSIEEEMPKLSIAAGRSDLALPMQRILDLLHDEGGWLPEKVLKCRAGKDLTPMEQFSVLRFMTETDQIYIKPVEDANKVVRMMVMLPRKYEEVKKAGGRSG